MTRADKPMLREMGREAARHWHPDHGPNYAEQDKIKWDYGGAGLRCYKAAMKIALLDSGKLVYHRRLGGPRRGELKRPAEAV